MRSHDAKAFLLKLRHVAESLPPSESHGVDSTDDPSLGLAGELRLLVAAMDVSLGDLEQMEPEQVTRRFGRVTALLVDQQQIELGAADQYHGTTLSPAEAQLISAYRAGDLPIVEREVVPELRAEDR